MRDGPPATTDQVRARYDRFARWFDAGEALPEWLGVRRLRAALLARAAGRVLEVSAGTGQSFRHYPAASRHAAVDLSAAMLAARRRRARRLGRPVALAFMDVERLGFPDRVFDTVADTMSLCTWVDPVAALRELARVYRPEGRLLLLEHGRSDRLRLGRWQDRRADRHARRLGCRWNREPLELVRQAGLPVVGVRRTFFGVFHLIEARPA